MQSMNLKDEVSKALEMEWEAFAAAHPRLAAAIDREVLVEEATASLSDDPLYRAAMEEAATMSVPAGLVTDLVRTVVKQVLDRLI